MKLKEESEKVGLKLNIQKTKIMVSSLITSWQIDGEKVETVTYFISQRVKVDSRGRREKREAGKRSGGRFEDALLLALKMENGARHQEIQEVPRS